MSSTQASDSKLKIIRAPGRNPCFDEKLGERQSLRMMQIPSGNFLMGSPEDELDNYENEQPQHKVNVATFFLGKYPVTQAQWRFVAELAQVERELDSDPSDFKGENHPVERVNWYEAVEFCQRLSTHTNRPYRLPSEAEWEYACRAGSTTPFTFGKTLTTEIANYDGNYTYNNGPEGSFREETTTVDNFEIANAFGLCDIHGNVLEWCADHWHENYKDAPPDGSVWQTDYEHSYRLLRGGSCFDNPKYCRSAARLNLEPPNRTDSIGFRICCPAPRTV